jgi:protein O-GlcNAc transferase
MNINEAIQSALKHHQSGKLHQAEHIYKKILKIKEDNFDALHMLGVLYSQLGKHDLAIKHISRAVQVRPASFRAHYNLGNVFRATGLKDQAISCCKISLRLNPDFVDAHFSLGQIFQENNQFDDAIVCYKKVIGLDPKFYGAYHHLGDILQGKGFLPEAISLYQEALKLNPDLAETHNNLGIAFRAQGKIGPAIDHYQKAVKLNPDFTNAFYNLGVILRETGRLEEAVDVYDKAIRSKPKDIKLRWAKCMSQLPILYPSQASIEYCRNHYKKSLSELRDTIPLKKKQDINAAAEAVGSQQPFYLAYQGFNDLELQKIYGNLVCKIMALRYPEFADSPAMPPRSEGNRLRIGIVSGFFYHHTVWKLYRGWVENTDRQRFSLHGYYTGKTKDGFTEDASKHFNRFVGGVHSFEDLCKIIHDDNLHALIYPEIGMDPITMRLASLRLAPVQCVSWGHPDTSGFPTIDYFLSSDLMETPEADSHYREELVRLPNISIYYDPPDVAGMPADRNTFGLREQSVLYLCCQSLFKYLPQYDEIYPLIAHKVKDCQFLFISHQSDFVTTRFRLRINKAFQQFNLNADDHVVFLPRLNAEQYHAVNRISDIYLDSIGWSGGNTTLEAVAYNLPIVTLPGKFMRERHSFAILTMIEAQETIASTLAEYLELAERLGNDAGWRHQISGKIAEKKHRLYRDNTCITALEDFLIKAVEKKLK